MTFTASQDGCLKLIVLLATLIACGAPHFKLIESVENGLARTPPMGWLAWERFTCEIDCVKYPETCINAHLFQTMADRLIDLKFPDFGYTYVNIDDCWSEKVRHEGSDKLIPNATSFPEGILGVATYMHERGLKLGLYGDCGDWTCAGYPAQLKPNSSDDYFEVDANTFSEWKIDSFKLDGCYIEPARAEMRCPAFSKALNSTGRPILLVCEWPFYLAAYTQQEPNWQLVADACNLWRYYDDIEDSWVSILNTVDYTIAHQETFVKYHGPGHWFDPDQLVIGDFGLSKSEEEAQMAIWAVWAAPLYMSNDLRKLSESSKAILQNRNLIGINQDKLGVLGLMTQEARNGTHQAFVKPVLPIIGYCPSFAIVYLNRESLGNWRYISFKLADLLKGATLAIEQASIHASALGNSDKAHFNARNCIESLNAATELPPAMPTQKKDLNVENKTEVYNYDYDDYELLQPIDQPQKPRAPRAQTYRVFDLLASSSQAIHLFDVPLSGDLELRVDPSGVRALKLELSSEP